MKKKNRGDGQPKFKKGPQSDRSTGEEAIIKNSDIQSNKASKHPSRSRNSNDRNNYNNHHNKRSRSKKQIYPEHAPMEDCLARYVTNDRSIIRGKLRVLPGGSRGFVGCDRGLVRRDVIINNEVSRNRAIDGDTVFVEITGTVERRNEPLVDCNNCMEIEEEVDEENKSELKNLLENLQIDDEDVGSNDIISNSNDDSTEESEKEEYEDADFEDYNIGEDEDFENEKSDSSHDEIRSTVKTHSVWQDDEKQVALWNPVVNIRKRDGNKTEKETMSEDQFQGIVVQIILPKTLANPSSEINPYCRYQDKVIPRRTIVGTLAQLPGMNSTRFLLVPSNRSLPRFMTPNSTQKVYLQQIREGKDSDQIMYKADYVYGSWSNTDKWPPCVNLKIMGNSCNIEDETMALLAENGVDHGEFSRQVLKDVEDSVSSGRIRTEDGDIGWSPSTVQMKGRRDYRSYRVFTIDPTTAKDLDDALHIKELPDGLLEIGVHIADVSSFIPPDSAVDDEASRRATTVYLVDRTIPMLPRPLCEIACSLNENVERLAMSCVWKMNADGTLVKSKKGEKGNRENDVWFGRTVIKSCARLDYASAQNIIENKVGNNNNELDESLWPKHRQPVGHTIEDVAKDVRLMHKVAKARRQLRFQNGALGLNGIKLAFQLGSDGQTPSLCEPYPIRDSNRLVEEFMLIANYLVAQRLITHGGGLAMLRHHPPPLQTGVSSVVEVAKESVGFHIDGSSSQRLQESLSQMSMEVDDELAMQCVTEMLMTPMRPAEYIAAGKFEEEEWSHFALHIPYYTHFTSPIRRYPDVIVHRLLQATIDGKDAVRSYSHGEEEIQGIARHCNEKRVASKKAQERSERVFLSIFLKKNPVESTLGVVLSVGEKAFTVFVPAFGLSAMVFVDDHTAQYDITVNSRKDDDKTKRSMIMKHKEKDQEIINIKTFTKLNISCRCKEKPPIDISLRVVGPWLQ